MKPVIKINFTDFWWGFVNDNNYFYNLLSERYTVVLDDKDPEYIFYSCYGYDYLKYKCIRIYYTPDNWRPDFSACDYAISFDFNRRKNHLRFPLYGYYIDSYPTLLNKDVSGLFKKRSREELAKKWKEKTKFCCLVVSNAAAKKRIDFFHSLDKVKKVDSGGRYLNNVGGPVEDKLEFISDYRFVISFENAAYPGYTTEKILEPIMTDSIPLYWGNPRVNEDFNEKRFLNYDSFKTEEDFINKIMELENDPEKAIDMICEPPFPGGFEPPVYIREKRLVDFLERIFKESKTKTPVARTHKKHVHTIKRKSRLFAEHGYHKMMRILKR